MAGLRNWQQLGLQVLKLAGDELAGVHDGVDVLDAGPDQVASGVELRGRGRVSMRNVHLGCEADSGTSDPACGQVDIRGANDDRCYAVVLRGVASAGDLLLGKLGPGKRVFDEAGKIFVGRGRDWWRRSGQWRLPVFCLLAGLDPTGRPRSLRRALAFAARSVSG